MLSNNPARIHELNWDVVQSFCELVHSSPSGDVLYHVMSIDNDFIVANIESPSDPILIYRPHVNDVGGVNMSMRDHHTCALSITYGSDSAQTLLLDMRTRDEIELDFDIKCYEPPTIAFVTENLCVLLLAYDEYVSAQECALDVRAPNMPICALPRPYGDQLA